MGIATVGIGWAAMIGAVDDTYCERGDSNYGELSWSRLPPGPVCSWTEQRNGFTGTDGPTPVMSIWLLTLLVLGFIALRLIGRVSFADPQIDPVASPPPRRQPS